MARTMLTDGSNKWFDATKAVSWDEDTYHDGNNLISVATGSQWIHERLHKTRQGRFVLNHWSQGQGSSEFYTEISESAAYVWLMQNGHDSVVPQHVIAAHELQ